MCASPFRTPVARLLSASFVLVASTPAWAGGAPDLIAHWTFDEGSGAVVGDSSGMGHAGAVQGGAVWVPGVVGGALQLNGTNAFVNFGNPATLNPSGAFTISAWFRPTAAWSGSGNDPVVDKGFTSHNPPYYQYHLGVTGTQYPAGPGSVGFSTSSGAGAGTGAGALTIGAWHLLTATTDASSTRLYLNGQLVGTGPGGAPPADYGRPVLVGKFGNLNLFLKGEVDDIQIYGRALSCAEVRCLYLAPGSTANGAPSPTADLNGDGSVNGGDLGLLLAAWGECTASACDSGCVGDLDCSGTVDGSDLGALLAAWGTAGAP